MKPYQLDQGKNSEETYLFVSSKKLVLFGNNYFIFLNLKRSFLLDLKESYLMYNFFAQFDFLQSIIRGLISKKCQFLSSMFWIGG